MSLSVASSPRLMLFGLACTALASVAWLVTNAAEAQTFPQGAQTQAASSGLPGTELQRNASWNLNSSVVKGAAQPSLMPMPVPAAPQPLVAAPLVKVEKPNMLIVSIDGLRPDCLLRADTPNIRALMSRGSFTLWARTTDIAITTPSHISMLTGVTPERHGISFNTDPPDDARILVPTIFDYAKDHGISTGMASGKRKFVLFTRTHNVDYSALAKEVTAPDADVGSWAAQIITQDKPRLMFVHFAGADVAGHGTGWGTPEQISAISGIDVALGKVLSAYDTAGLTGNTYIIVSADHGGTARSHGPGDPRSHFIPWILVGPGVRQNCDLTRFGRAYDVATFDTFATAAYILGLPVPSDSDGKPIFAAFTDFDMLMSTDAASWAVTTTVPTTRGASTPMLHSATRPTTRP